MDVEEAKDKAWARTNDVIKSMDAGSSTLSNEGRRLLLTLSALIAAESFERGFRHAHDVAIADAKALADKP